MENSTNMVIKDGETVDELRVRVTLLESELTQTNNRLSSVEAAVQALESRCAASELVCDELRQRVANVCALLESARNEDGKSFSRVDDCSVGDVGTTDLTKSTTACCQTDEAHSESAAAAGENLQMPIVIVPIVTDCKPSLETVKMEWTSAECNSSGAGAMQQVESVADGVRAAAESAVTASNFVFDSQTGLYYDYVTGYYYDAEKSLYYEPQSGLYFYFDETTRVYKYHSRVDAAKQNMLTHIIFNRAVSTSKEKKVKTGHKTKHLQKTADNPDTDMKDVEVICGNRKEKRDDLQNRMPSHDACDSTLPDKVAKVSSDDGIDENVDDKARKERSSESSSEFVVELEDGEIGMYESVSSDEESSIEEVTVAVEETQNCTPCVRAMVVESRYLPVGSLYIITCTGGTIGRDTSLNHTIVIPDPLISKMHCSVEYDAQLQRYIIKDYATQIGTFVNRIRLSPAKTMSQPQALYHGDVVRLAGTTFDFHIHPRTETCGGCEPGCTLTTQKNGAQQDATSSKDKETVRRSQLKTLKSKFGLKAMNYEDHPSLRGGAGSVSTTRDRAAMRRKTVGSDLPDDAVRVEQASSVHRPISEKNIGRKMLAKMGWKEGESLGNNRDDAIREPINVDLRLKQSAGLGAYAGTQRSLDDVGDAIKNERWIKTQDRYAKLANRNAPRSPDVCEMVDDVLAASGASQAASDRAKFARWVKTNSSNIHLMR